MIDVAHLTKTYGEFTAVNDFSFSVAPGEIVGLIGPNGAGKTSTLRSIAGIHAPTAGAITVAGHNIVSNPVEAKQHLAFIADEPQLFEYLTVTEHLQLVSRIYFPGDPANNADPVLRLVPAERRATLIAKKTGRSTLEWNVALQGRHETVFFD